MFGKIIPHIADPRKFKVEAHVRPAIEPGFAPFQVRAEQRHSATNVATDEMRIDDFACRECSADWPALSRM